MGWEEQQIKFDFGIVREQSTVDYNNSKFLCYVKANNRTGGYFGYERSFQ